MKLNVLLGKTDHLASTYNALVKSYITFFKGKQGAFLGERRTYEPRVGTVDEPGKRKNAIIQTTVHEKFVWLKDNSADYIDALFSVEATNASGNATSKLIVNGDDWGTFSSLELLRLKSLIENNDLKGMLENIPVRSDSNIWEINTTDQYKDRTVFQTPLTSGVEKTTVKESFILEDPNIGKIDVKSYAPQLATKNTTLELGDYTHQYFSGEISQREKANILKRRSGLLTSVIEALKQCNDVEAVPSKLNSDKILNYIIG